MKGMRIAVRADASRDIGTGHVMRCLSLAAALAQRGARVYFVTRRHPGNLNREIEARGFCVRELPPASDSDDLGHGADDADGYLGWLGVGRERDARDTLEVIGEDRPDWLVVDHYALGHTWEARLRSRVANILVIDELANRSHDCDVLLDQSVASGGMRRWDELVPPHCTRLVGPGFALLRDEFRRARDHLKPRDGTVRRLVVSFGGVDAANLTGRTLEALHAPALAHLSVDVVVGARNPHLAALREQAAGLADVCLHCGVEDMAELMARADLAIGAGGVTTWEMLCLGLPTLIVTAASNQRPSTRALHEDGYVTWLGDESFVSADSMRMALLRAVDDAAGNRDKQNLGLNLVDGRGTYRVAEFLSRGVPSDELTIRRARPDDCILYRDWVNDPEVRANAFNPAPIPREVHERWYCERMEDPGSFLFVVEFERGPVGQVRFERGETGFCISYSLGRQFRGRGMGRPFLAKAISHFREISDAALVAETLSSNRASARIFERLGFSEIDPVRPGSRRFRLGAGRPAKDWSEPSEGDEGNDSSSVVGSPNRDSAMELGACRSK